MLKMGAKAAAAVGGGAGGAGASNAGSAGSAGASTASSASSAGKPARASARTLELLLQLSREQLTQETLAERLRRAVDKFEREAMLSTVNTEAVQRSPLFLQARRVEPRMEPKGGAGGAKGGPARALSQGVVDLTDVTDVTDADADSALGKRKAEEVGEVEVLDARGLRGPGWRAARLRPVTGSPGTGGDLEFFLSV
ncbi:hypothetical protein B484DRAFT_389710 [Ochromonadaceae sp. CCMP2298]|nr:hypothetical protein B484DRAFT_389710 [Ochromonadaceae sp. CCMP2298]